MQFVDHLVDGVLQPGRRGVTPLGGHQVGVVQVDDHRVGRVHRQRHRVGIGDLVGDHAPSGRREHRHLPPVARPAPVGSAGDRPAAVGFAGCRQRTARCVQVVADAPQPQSHLTGRGRPHPQGRHIACPTHAQSCSGGRGVQFVQHTGKLQRAGVHQPSRGRVQAEGHLTAQNVFGDGRRGGHQPQSQAAAQMWPLRQHRFGEALGVEPQVCGVPVHRFAGGGIDAAVGRPVQSPVECVRIDADGHRVDRPSDQPTRHPVAGGQGEVGCADQSAHQRMMPRALASAMDCGVAPGSPSAIGTTATAVP